MAKRNNRVVKLKVKKRRGRPRGSTRSTMRRRRLKEVKKALKTLRKLVPLLAA